MKKWWTRLVALLLACGMLAGCAGKQPAPSPSLVTEKDNGKQEPYQIGLLQYRETNDLNSVREAFMSRLEEWGYDDAQVVIDYQNAEGQKDKAASICKQFVKDGADMIVALSTPAAQEAVAAVQNTNIRVVFAGENNAVTTLGIKNSDRPEGNITGVAGQIPVSQTIDLALKGNAGLKKLGLLYSGGETSVNAVLEEARSYCNGKGVEIAEKAVNSDGEIPQAAAQLCAETDALLTVADNALAAAASKIAEEAKKAKKPWYAGSASLVQEGALAAVGLDYSELGRTAADMAVGLMAGKQVSQVPVEFLRTGEIYFNQETQAELDITFSEEVMREANFMVKEA